jgi:hypothetical protein
MLENGKLDNKKNRIENLQELITAAEDSKRAARMLLWKRFWRTPH